MSIKNIIRQILITFRTLRRLRSSSNGQPKTVGHHQQLLKLSVWPGGLPEEMKSIGAPSEHFSFFEGEYQLGDELKTFVFRKEFIPGKRFPVDTEVDLSNVAQGKDAVFPICLTGKNESRSGSLTFRLGKRLIELEHTKRCRWRYFNIPAEEKQASVISSSCDIVVGEPLFKQTTKGRRVGSSKEIRPKVVFCLIVDSLSQLILSQKPDVAIDNTRRFFEKGRIFSNNYSQCEWTLPSTASIMTGLNPSHHRIYDPKSFAKFSDIVSLQQSLSYSHPTIGQYFRKAGYLTFGGCAGWRAHPLYGFSRGFDRYLYYGNNNYTQSDKLIIDDAIEQIKAFPDRDHFIYLHLNQLHSQDPHYWSLGTEVNVDIDELRTLKPKGRINRLHYPEIVARYRRTLSEVDQNLKTIYKFLEAQFSDEEFLVTLSADHGVAYLNDDHYLLSEAMTNVPLMVRSCQIPEGVDDSLVHLVDILPNLQHLCGIESKGAGIDGRLWPVLGGERRKYALSESIYPFLYQLKIAGKDRIYHLQSKINKERIDFASAKRNLWQPSEINPYNLGGEITDSSELEPYEKIAKDYIEEMGGRFEFH